MKHFTLSFFLVVIFAFSVSSQNFVRMDQKNIGEKVLLSQDQVLEISLPSTPSTGYSWNVVNSNGDIIKQVGDYDFISDNPDQPIGASGIQITRFIGGSKGTAELQLAYARTWEKDQAPLEVYKISVESKGSYTGTYTAVAKPSAPVDYGQTTRALPAAFSWQAQGLCTPCKNQASCGSCWTFAACGSFESVIKIKDGVTRDLSEQWIVNCDKSNSGCSGGWCPDGMFLNGAVYEADQPYKAANGTCKTTYTYHEKIDSWHQIATNPTVAQIKQAIYDYGPVWAAICAGSNFQNYSSGVSTKSDGTSVNHAIVLCGWDDATSSWVLRNSWGTGWGEKSGYMRIKYGTSNVGYRAAYLVYKGGITTDIPTINQVNNIQVFPNPTTGVFSITGLEKENNVEVYDVVGNLVYKTTTKDATYNVDLTANKQGMYFYKIINSGNEIQRGKIVKD